MNIEDMVVTEAPNREPCNDGVTGSAPSGGVGGATDGSGGGLVECSKCGVEVPVADRCERCGTFLPGNLAGAVVGHRGRQFWQQHEAARRELREAVVADAGHDLDDAPRALLLAADSIAQATLIRDSAYLRLGDEGGPLTSSGRARRAFEVWVRATDRLERHLRLVGLARAPRPVPSLEEYLRERQQQTEDDDDPAADEAATSEAAGS